MIHTQTLVEDAPDQDADALYAARVAMQRALDADTVAAARAAGRRHFLAVPIVAATADAAYQPTAAYAA